MNTYTLISEWRTYYSCRGIDSYISDQYIAYISKLLHNKVPIIFNFEHLSLLLGRQKRYLASVINSPQDHYREFKIKKRSGGDRIISVPYPALLEMQYWIYDNILKAKKPHHSAHGFVQKKSIITNASSHVGQKELLKIDIKDYFPSIGINRVILLFKSFGYPNIVAFYLASICCNKRSLPQGAPTSPAISNLIAVQMDKRLRYIAMKNKLKYTRYADDLAFSGENISNKIISDVINIIKEEKFCINENKLRLYTGNARKIITGISITNNKIAVPREYKRSLKQELHYIKKFGFNSHVGKMKIKDPNYYRSLLGKINYWLSIEPDNSYALSAKQMMKECFF